MNGIFDEGNGITTRVSVSTSGVAADRETGGAKISGAGLVIAMVGPANNLVSEDTYNSEDVFVRDLNLAQTERVSVSSTGTQASTPIAFPPDSDDPSMSADGRYVAFRSFGLNLVSRDINLLPDVFLLDRDSDNDGIFDEAGAIVITRVSVTTAGIESKGISGGAKISADGSVVAYYSDAKNLVPTDNNLARDVFVFSSVINESCGDSVCDTAGGETCENCPADCSTGCGDGCCSVAMGESSCNCAADCGAPTLFETDCSDGLDNDCNGVLELISSATSGSSNGASSVPTISGDGR